MPTSKSVSLDNPWIAQTKHGCFEHAIPYKMVTFLILLGIKHLVNIHTLQILHQFCKGNKILLPKKLYFNIYSTVTTHTHTYTTHTHNTHTHTYTHTHTHTHTRMEQAIQCLLKAWMHTLSGHSDCPNSHFELDIYTDTRLKTGVGLKHLFISLHSFYYTINHHENGCQWGLLREDVIDPEL